MMIFDLIAHLERQKAFSEKTFGPGMRTKGIINHIQKELGEIEAYATDLEEWIDVVILALDGAWRAGHTPVEIVQRLMDKQARNEQRDWPDWRTLSQDDAIEHKRYPSGYSSEASKARVDTKRVDPYQDSQFLSIQRASVRSPLPGDMAVCLHCNEQIRFNQFGKWNHIEVGTNPDLHEAEPHPF